MRTSEGFVPESWDCVQSWKTLGSSVRRLGVNEGVGDGTLVGLDIGVINKVPLGRSVGGTFTRGEDPRQTGERWPFGTNGGSDGGT